MYSINTPPIVQPTTVIETIKYWIYKFNVLTTTQWYQALFYLGALFSFLFSYYSQYKQEKPCNNIFATIIRTFHHFILYFVYLGFLAPAPLIGLVFLIDFIAITTWIGFKNKCILTLLENHLCGHNSTRKFRDILSYISKPLDRIITIIRIPMMAILVIVIVLRTYVYKRTTRVAIQAHRGDRGSRPENTLSAFEYALNHGITTLELDLHMTNDGHLIIYHDDTIDQTLCKSHSIVSNNTPIPVKSLSLKDIKTYDCGTIQNKKFPNQRPIPGEPIPTFVELINLINTKYPLQPIPIILNVEIKTTKEMDSDEYVKLFAKKLVATIYQYNFQNRVIIQSFDTRALKAVRAINTIIPTSYLIDDTIPINKELIKQTLELEAIILSPEHTLLTPDIVNELHKNKLYVLPWTVNTIEEAKRMVDIKVDGIITDYPDVLSSYLSLN